MLVTFTNFSEKACFQLSADVHKILIFDRAAKVLSYL